MHFFKRRGIDARCGSSFLCTRQIDNILIERPGSVSLGSMFENVTRSGSVSMNLIGLLGSGS